MRFESWWHANLSLLSNAEATTEGEMDWDLLGVKNKIPYFPHWYPALVFALAGIVALRFRRQFSIRSALVGTAVVAALIGTVVAL